MARGVHGRRSGRTSGTLRGGGVTKRVFLIQGPRRSARLHLDGPFFVVGRGEPFPIFQDDPTLSREHCAIVDTPAGFRVKDLGSANGVLLNGRRLARYEESPLAVGDRLQAGATAVLLVELSEDEGSRITVDAGGPEGPPSPDAAEPDPGLDGEATLALEPHELSGAGLELEDVARDLGADPDELGLAADESETETEADAEASVHEPASRAREQAVSPRASLSPTPTPSLPARGAPPVMPPAETETETETETEPPRTLLE
jgi:pSer/pThr/pTyr-binding forkhead associated (FHA) protein